MVAGGTVAIITGRVDRWLRGQQSCSWLVATLVDGKGQRNATDEAAGTMLQQIVEAAIIAATILFRMILL